MTPLSAVVFDFDGVLADSEPLHLRAYREVLAPAGVTISAAAYCERYLGLDDEGAFRAVGEDFGLEFNDGEIERLIREKARVYEAAAGLGGVMYAAAGPCVRRLASKWPLGIASGARREEIEMILRAVGLRDAFAFIVATGDTPRSKPWPDPYERAAALHRVAAGSCVAIEDSPAGLQSARDAGLRTIAVTHTYPREAVAWYADAVVESLDEITVEFVDRLLRTKQP